MSSSFWEITMMAVALAICITGGAYCRHDIEDSYRECVKVHAPRDCRP